MKKDLEQLRGAGKILDMLWNNSYYGMGKKASARIEQEMIYYFGKNWATDMYKLIEDGELPHEIKLIKTLKELSNQSSVTED